MYHELKSCRSVRKHSWFYQFYDSCNNNNNNWRRSSGNAVIRLSSRPRTGAFIFICFASCVDPCRIYRGSGSSIARDGLRFSSDECVATWLGSGPGQWHLSRHANRTVASSSRLKSNARCENRVMTTILLAF